MKKVIKKILLDAISELQVSGQLSAELTPEIIVERGRDKQHGDFACNIALTLAKQEKRKPRDLAEEIVANLKPDEMIEKVEIAGPGFINFFVRETAFQKIIDEILQTKEHYGKSTIGQGQRLHLEYVSANPTGPLHVGHGRGAAYGSVLASLLKTAGYQVHQEYYVNDAGRQMDILTVSVWLRYLEKCGERIIFPANAYQGDYIVTIADQLVQKHGNHLLIAATELYQSLPDAKTLTDKDEKEHYIDTLIAKAKQLLGDKNYRIVLDKTLAEILGDIRHDLEQFGVSYDDWYSERAMIETGAVNTALESLKSKDLLYELEGAWWFRSSNYGDEKDRVVIRDNGQITYFASDLAYHLQKLDSGYDQAIDIWGADHHGYVPRIKASLQAAGADPARLEVLLVQFASLFRGGEKVQMSTRSGSFVTLRELREEVGNDATRFFYIMRKCEQHMDFDIDLAKSRSNENPVYYIQYAHARICSVMRQLTEKGLSWDQQNGLENLGLLIEPHEKTLLRTLSRYPEVIEMAAHNHEPHQIAHYLRDLANDFHVYYNAHQFLVSSTTLCNTRIALIQAVKQVIRNGLDLLGVTAPDVM